ncbi:MAG: divalent metal cation transporter [Candidatus Micrarchaeota archaeon]
MNIRRRGQRIVRGVKRIGRGVAELGEERIFKGAYNVKGGLRRVGKEVRDFSLKDTPSNIRRYRRLVGPGVVTGAADDDAGGILTYSLVGATTGYALLWLMLLSTPMLIAIQSICARLGNVTRKGLTSLIRERWGMKIAAVVVLLVIVGNVGTIAAEIAGMSVAAQLLTGIKWQWFALPFSAIALYVLIYKNFKWIQRGLLFLALFLLAYVAAGVLASPDWAQVLYSTLIPRMQFDSMFLFAAVALLGTTISPYLMFYQTSSEVEANRTSKDLKKSMPDTAMGMLYSNVGAYFIIITSAAWFYSRGITITDVEQAALALKPLAGDYSFYLFAVGLFGASALALMVLASSTAYAISALFEWPRGLNQHFKRAKNFYYAIAASIALGLLVLALGISPISAMIYSQFFLGLTLPFIVYALMRIVNDEKVVGQFKPSWSTNVFGWFTFVISTLLVLLLFADWLGAK